jgi:acetylornithine deacetylase/succinyl-diaminopimelate desuccinylase-like protein
MRRTVLGIAIALIMFSASAAAQVPSVDWNKQEAEILRHYRALVEINTSNPPGNESADVEYMKRVLEAEGIPTQVFALDPSRANLVARIRGNGTKRPILVMAHTDVVGVQRERWPVDPFGAVVKDGYIWGRGTTDDKDKLVANLMLMLLLKRTGAPLDRDVIFLAEAGEEGDTSVGIDFMVNQHFDAINAEYALTEGGHTTLENGKVKVVTVTTTEKVPRRVRLVARGTSGHASIPRIDNPVGHLAAAVAKLFAWETPMRLNDTTRAYFERLAAISPPHQAARYRELADPQHSAAIQRYFAEYEPEHYSMLRTSVVPTILNAGFRSNVIPSQAEATIDVRALPDEDVPKLYQEMREVISDPAVEIQPLTEGARPVAPPSRLDTEMFRALEQVSERLYPGSTTLPAMLPAATDMAQLRSKGIESYGIGPATTEDDWKNHSWHSDVERLPESSLYSFVEFLWSAVTQVAVSK